MSMNVLWVIGSTVVKMLYGILVYKYIAVTYGIESLGVAGQLLSLMSILLILSNAGIDRGIIRSYSRNIDNPEKIQRLDRASTFIFLCSSFIIFSVLMLTAEPISRFVFGTASYQYLVYFLAFISFFMGLNNNVMSVGIAYGKSKTISQATIIAFLMGGMGVFYFGELNFNMLLTVVAVQGIFLSLSLLLINYKGIRQHISVGSVSRYLADIKTFLSFSFVIVLPVLMMQLTLIVNRIHISEGFGTYQLGLWESTIKLQEGYIQIAGVLLIYFMFPKASKSLDSAYKATRKYIGIVFLLLLFVMLVVAMFGDLILQLVYNEETMVVAGNLLVLTVGDVFRSVFIVNQYLLLAIAKIKVFIVFEVFVYLSSVLYVWHLSNAGSFDSLYYGYLVQSVILSVISFYIVRRWANNV